MALSLVQVIENCRKFNMNSGAGTDEFNKIYDILIACDFDTLRKTDNALLMALEKGSKVWIVECRITKDYNMFKDWQSDINGSGYIGLLNLSKKVWGYKKADRRLESTFQPYWMGDTLFTAPDTCFRRDCRISALDMSVRSFNVLMRSGVETVGQLYNLLLDVNTVMRVRNMGRRSAIELYGQLNMTVPSELRSEELAI
jgi:hypothetical protein